MHRSINFKPEHPRRPLGFCKGSWPGQPGFVATKIPTGVRAFTQKEIKSVYGNIQTQHTINIRQELEVFQLPRCPNLRFMIPILKETFVMLAILFAMF